MTVIYPGDNMKLDAKTILEVAGVVTITFYAIKHSKALLKEIKKIIDIIEDEQIKQVLRLGLDLLDSRIK